MIDRWAALRRRAASQGGYVTRRQVMALDIAVVAALASGMLDGVEHDLFRLADSMPDRFDEIARHCALTGGVVSHQSAAAVFGMGDCRPHFLHLSCATTVDALDSALAVHRRALRDDEICDVGAFRITTPLTTVLDLAESSIGQSVLDCVVADAIAIGRIGEALIATSAATQSLRTGKRLHCALLARP